MLDFDLSTNLSKRMASFLFFLSCFNSLIYCKFPHIILYCNHPLMILLPNRSQPANPNIFFTGANCPTQADIDQHTAVYFKLASLHYQLGEVGESLNKIRECLRLDLEHKDCYPMYKKVKKVAKFLVGAKEAREGEDWESCVSNAQKALKNEPKVNRTSIKHCQRHNGPEG